MKRSQTKRILVAYDGSDSSRAALEDLKNAGMPEKTEALVVTVADVFIPPGAILEPALSSSMPAAFEGDWNYATQSLEHAKRTAEEGARRLAAIFPRWQVKPDFFSDSPSWGIIRRAREWKADLIVAGAHGLHSPGRIMMGSVSQIVATQAPCSVRIVHEKKSGLKSPLRLLAGIDGSSFARSAIREIASRSWKKGTVLHLVAVKDSRIRTAVFRQKKDKHPGVEKALREAAGILQARGLKVLSFQKEGDPKKILLSESKRWGVDCIFVGARGLSGIMHVLLGSVSAALAARASCAVEIVRKP